MSRESGWIAMVVVGLLQAAGGLGQSQRSRAEFEVASVRPHSGGCGFAQLSFEDSPGTPARTVHNPFQNLHIFAESRPDKLTVRILPEPVDMENPRRFFETALHLEAVPEIISHVVSAEGKHAMGSRRTLPAAPAAAVVSDPIVAHRPPKIIAVTGTPFGDSHSGSFTPFWPSSGVHSFPCQSGYLVACGMECSA